MFCYALSPNDGTEWRQRTQSEAEHFVDVSAMTLDMIAKTINEDKIHILVNLNGYTKVYFQIIIWSVIIFFSDVAKREKRRRNTFKGFYRKQTEK